MRCALLLLVLLPSLARAGEWDRLASVPDKKGFAGSFAGATHGALLVAGGANFPEKKPWEGGTKVWYDTVFVLEKPAGEWKVAGKLPHALGYGVSVTHRTGVVCVGGSDAKRHYPDAFRLEWSKGQLVTTALPALPRSVANACGALVGDTLYVVGGLETPDATATLKNAWKLDLAAREPKWVEIAPYPGGGRMLAAAASLEGKLWIAGGVDLVAGKDGKLERRYRKDAYCYDPTRGWKRLADLPAARTGAPSPAPTDATGFFVLGGDDGSQLTVAPAKHRGFAKNILRYEPKTDTWSEANKLPTSLVTTPCVHWQDSWIVPGGEIRPGVRSPQVWRWTPGAK